jgi:hypothetical protein
VAKSGECRDLSVMGQLREQKETLFKNCLFDKAVG